MKLKSAHVTHFRSVEDSGPFKIDQVTCLVGKNESGKTTLLQALYRLNPDKPDKATYSREEDYPRRFLNDYDELHPDGADVIETVWELESRDRQALIDALGPAAHDLHRVTVVKGYAPNERAAFIVNIDEKAVARHLLQTSGLTDAEQAQLASEETVAGLRTAVAKIQPPQPQYTALTTALAKFPPPDGDLNSAEVLASTILQAQLPKFVYFSQYNRMQGRVALAPLQQKISQSQKLEDSEQTFLDFCAFANTTLNELATIARFETLTAKFEGASSKITQKIFKYWTQNRFLRVLFSRNTALAQDPAPFNTGEIFNIRIRNELHDSSVPFDERSAGFVWFFSFLVFFSQMKKKYKDLIILLDEPGLTLHARAQSDLLRYFDEELAPHHQVIYTTHSPFMIPPEFMRVRTVHDVWYEKDGEMIVEGTKVGDDVLSTDRDTVFPLQTALGYEMTQSLFVGKNTLCVEGPGDILVLQAFSETLLKAKRTSLKREWTICPVGGITKIAAFASLFGGNKLNIAVLVDYAMGDKKKVEDLRRHELLKAGRVFTADSYAGQPEADIEDIIGADNYVALVNATYNLSGTQAVAVPGTMPTRIVKHVEAHFQTLPLGAPEFDHFAPSRYLIERGTAFLPDEPGALARFEKLFVDLNGLLPTK
jgi:predicted ATPase